MLSLKRIVGFFVRLMVIYILLVIPWPGLKGTYAILCSAGGNLVFRSLIPGGTVRFEPIPDPPDKYDTYLHFVNERSGAKGTAKASSRDPGYLQTAFLVSLVLATPLPWGRRLRALLWGLILVNAAITCKMLVTVLYGFTARLNLLKPTPVWDTVLQVANRITLNDVVMLLMVPVFIWILVSFRRTDWELWLEADAPATAVGWDKVNGGKRKR